MSPLSLSIVIIAYFFVLILISQITSRKADNASFFLGNRKSPWYIVAFGMIGASLSGVTFISIPGWVGASQFSYLQVVIGYLFGYFVIAVILMPVYYKLNLTSIYSYLQQRFGFWSYKTGVVFFLFSRTFGAAARLFIVANILQYAILDNWNVPFYATVVITILLIWIYTFKGGIKTIIWTDTLQTLFMLVAVGITVYIISKTLNLNFNELVATISDSDYSKTFFFDDWKAKSYFWKNFFGGAFIAIAMTGLDQDMMQKNLSCRNIKEGQKNILWFTIALIPVNILFLSLGALLYIFASQSGIILPADTDLAFPMIATGGYLNPIVVLFFTLGIIAAAYSSADSALTALTTSFSIDILNVKKYKNEIKEKTIRKRVHVGFSIVLIAVILAFKAINNTSVIDALFTVAGYTYGPLLGLYAFGLLTKYKITDSYKVLIIAILSPLFCYFISSNSEQWLNGYIFGYELLILNGIIMFLGLL
ncbi:MAG: sodium:solute symporter, partial [Bacteroidota bacterium]|nr:sodium:solute symporter [Bacteroidota bacterium]